MFTLIRLPFLYFAIFVPLLCVPFVCHLLLLFERIAVSTAIFQLLFQSSRPSLYPVFFLPSVYSISSLWISQASDTLPEALLSPPQDLCVASTSKPTRRVLLWNKKWRHVKTGIPYTSFKQFQTVPVLHFQTDQPVSCTGHWLYLTSSIF